MRPGPTRPASRLATISLLWLAGALLLVPDRSVAADWTLPDSRLGVRTAPILLLSRTDVQADLKLSSEQVLSARRTIADLHARAAALVGRPDAEVVASRRLIDEAQQRWLEQQLSDVQRARLLQIDLQWEGPMALISRPWLADQIGLTPEQRTKLAAMLKAIPAGTEDRPPAQAVLESLQPEQRQQWLAVLGPAFVVQRQDPAVGAAPAAAPRR